MGNIYEKQGCSLYFCDDRKLAEVEALLTRTMKSSVGKIVLKIHISHVMLIKSKPLAYQVTKILALFCYCSTTSAVWLIWKCFPHHGDRKTNRDIYRTQFPPALTFSILLQIKAHMLL